MTLAVLAIYIVLAAGNLFWIFFWWRNHRILIYWRTEAARCRRLAERRGQPTVVGLIITRSGADREVN